MNDIKIFSIGKIENKEGTGASIDIVGTPVKPSLWQIMGLAVIMVGRILFNAE